MHVRRLGVSVLGASLVVVTLALPLTVWLRRQLARSLARIDQTARALATGKAARIDTDQMDAEFAGVAGVLNEAFDRLEAAHAHERQLTSDVSHELRTPVATLVAETEWALAAGRSTDEYRRSLAVCARQACRMKDLIQTLLTLARIEAGMLARSRDTVDLRAVVDDALIDMAPLARERRISVQVEGHATVAGDGSGLGLAISQAVVAAHGGTICARRLSNHAAWPSRLTCLTRRGATCGAPETHRPGTTWMRRPPEPRGRLVANNPRGEPETGLRRFRLAPAVRRTPSRWTPEDRVYERTVLAHSE